MTKRRRTSCSRLTPQPGNSVRPGHYSVLPPLAVIAAMTESGVGSAATAAGSMDASRKAVAVVGPMAAVLTAAHSSANSRCWVFL